MFVAYDWHIWKYLAEVTRDVPFDIKIHWYYLGISTTSDVSLFFSRWLAVQQVFNAISLAAG